jgi:hypothetical protein
MNDIPADHPFDRQLATAYRDLENTIGNIHDACLLMEVAAEETVFAGETEIEKWVRGKIGGDGMPGYAITVSPKDDVDAICYALRHLGDLVRKLHDDYYAGFEKAAAE